MSVTDLFLMILTSTGVTPITRFVLVGISPGAVAVAAHDRLGRVLRVSGVRERQLAQQESGPCRANFPDVLACFAQTPHHRLGLTTRFLSCRHHPLAFRRVLPPRPLRRSLHVADGGDE